MSSRIKIFDEVCRYFELHGNIWGPRRLKESQIADELARLYPEHTHLVRCRLARLQIYPAPQCPVCDGLIKDPTQSRTCSKRCASRLPDRIKSRLEKTVKTNLKKYGVKWSSQDPVIREKQKKTCRKKYGVDSPLQSDQVRSQIKDSLLERHGVTTPFLSTNIQEKARETWRQKYGADNPSKNKEVQNKIASSIRKKYGANTYAEAVNLSQEALLVLSDKDQVESYLQQYGNVLAASKIGIDVTSFYRRLRSLGLEHYINRRSSQAESIIAATLDKLGLFYERNSRRIIPPKEVDFYLPEYNLAIEVNGIYWHSSANQPDPKYHHNKWLGCREKGVTLLSYTDTEIYEKLNIIAAKLRYMASVNKKVIGARQCKVSAISKEDEFQFLDDYHLQGRLYSRHGSLGAYYNGKLVAVLNWALRPKYLEITRYASDLSLGASFPGLFSKMVKAMLRQTEYAGDVVSFSDNDHSNGNMYRQSGFIEVAVLGPTYWYTNDFVLLENRQKYMKSKIQKQFGIDVSQQTEKELMEDLGYARYYDSGKIKWVLK